MSSLPSTISKSSSSRINSLLSSSSYSTSPSVSTKGSFCSTSTLLFVSGSGSGSEATWVSGVLFCDSDSDADSDSISEEFVAKFIELSLISGSAPPFISKVYSSNSSSKSSNEIVLSSSIMNYKLKAYFFLNGITALI